MILKILSLVPAAMIAYLLVDAAVSGQIGLNNRTIRRQTNPIGYWLVFALGGFMLYEFGLRWWIFRH